MPRFACVESTVDVTGDDGRTVRIWRAQGTAEEVRMHYDNADLVMVAREGLQDQLSAPEMVALLCRCPGIAAIQVIERDSKGVRAGVVAYVEWP